MFSVLLLTAAFTACHKQESETPELLLSGDMEKAFPDPEFRKIVIDRADRDRDGKISLKEAQSLRELSACDSDIESVQGIEYFTNLTSFDCSYNRLTSLDLSKNQTLIYIDCSHNKLSRLVLPESSNISTLDCSHNELSELNVSRYILLHMLACSYNPITELDISANKYIQFVMCLNCRLTALDTSNNPSMFALWCSNNRIGQLDLSKNKALRQLMCGNNLIQSLDISKTDFGNKNETVVLSCSPMESLQTLYIKRGWSIHGITESRSSQLIPQHTQILYAD